MFPTTRVSKVLPLLFKILSKSPIRIRVLSSRVPGFDTSAVESPRINKSTRSSDGFQQHQNSRGELCGEHQPNQDTNRRCGPCLWWRLSQQDRQSAVSFRPAFEHSWSSRRMQWLWSHPSIRSFFSPRIWSFHTSGLFTPRSLSQNCLSCLEKVKTYSPEWWFNNDLPWWNKRVKHHLKQTQVFCCILQTNTCMSSWDIIIHDNAPSLSIVLKRLRVIRQHRVAPDPIFMPQETHEKHRIWVKPSVVYANETIWFHRFLGGITWRIAKVLRLVFVVSNSGW